MTVRFGVYYAPACEDALWQRGAAWLGRDPETGAACPQPALPGIGELTADARVYGFHCTLKPPMRLRVGADWAGLLAATTAIAGGIPRFALPRLAVADLHGFLALRETVPCPPVQALADALVGGLDDFRQPPDEAELARRRRSRLSAAQDANLLRWGYPHVFDSWFFHMTLTRRLSPAEREVVMPAAEEFFASCLQETRMVEDVCLFGQAGPGLPFTLAARVPLAG